MSIRVIRFLFILFLSSYGLSELPGQEKVLVDIHNANAHFESLRYDSASIIYGQVIPLISKNTTPELYCRIINRHAAALYWQDKVHESDTLCLRNLKICRELLGENHPETAQALINVGVNKFIIGGRGIVADYFKEAAWILEDYYGPVHPAVAKAYEWLGTYCEGNADTIQSRQYLWKSYDLWKKSKGPDHPDLAEIYRYMGLYFKRYGNHDSALICFEKAKELFDNKYGEANFHSVKCLNNAADIYAEHDSLEYLVEPTYKKCEKLIGAFPSPNRFTVVMTLYNRAEYALFHENKHMVALEYMNRLLQEYFPDFKATQYSDNPPIPKDYFHWIPHLALLLKASIYCMLAETDTLNETKYLLLARESYRSCDELTDNIRLHLINFDDILMFANKHAKIYHKKAHTNFRLFQLTGDTTYLGSALTYISKMNLAHETIQAGIFEYKALGMPDEIYEKQFLLKEEINELKNQLLTTRNRQSAQRRISQKAIEQDLFFAEILKRYRPALQQIFTEPAVYVAQFQQSLGSDECLLILSENIQDHDRTPDFLTITCMTNDESRVEFISGKEVFLDVAAYHKMLTQRADVATLAEKGSALYQVLIEPFGAILKQKITIIPSARLSTLAFETLPAKANQQELMIHHYQISKIFSIQDFLKYSGKAKSVVQDSVLAIAPMFNSTRVREISMLAQRDSSLINLPGSIEECHRISDFFTTHLIDGFSATETEFKNHCTSYPILHISTHGVPAGNKTGTVKLAFSSQNPDELEDGWLSFFEIMNLKLNADLVVLSACKTGIGKMNNGMGNLNLAWAFRQAGAASALISLWDVNDYASSRIMPSFYRNLKNGMTKAEAIRRAKLEYLKNADETSAHPFYWAAFDYIGTSGEKAESYAGFSSSYQLVILVLLILISGLILYRKRL